MDNFVGVGDMDGEPPFTEVHEVIKIDSDILGLADGQNPPCAIISAIGGVVDVLGHEMHEKQSLCAA